MLCMIRVCVVMPCNCKHIFTESRIINTAQSTEQSRAGRSAGQIKWSRVNAMLKLNYTRGMTAAVQC